MEEATSAINGVGGTRGMGVTTDPCIKDDHHLLGVGKRNLWTVIATEYLPTDWEEYALRVLGVGGQHVWRGH